MSNAIRWSPEQLAAHQARQPKPAVPSRADRAAAAVKRTQALGRLKKGHMNKSEARYARHLDEQRLAGAVIWWKFEAIKLMIAANTSITVDFGVMLASGVIELHDVKGSKAMVTDDARAKMKVAAAQFPFVFKFVYLAGKGSSAWVEEEI